MGRSCQGRGFWPTADTAGRGTSNCVCSRTNATENIQQDEATSSLIGWPRMTRGRALRTGTGVEGRGSRVMQQRRRLVAMRRAGRRRTVSGRRRGRTEPDRGRQSQRKERSFAIIDEITVSSSSRWGRLGPWHFTHKERPIWPFGCPRCKGNHCTLPPPDGEEVQCCCASMFP
jgi:hypothetical protein